MDDDGFDREKMAEQFLPKLDRLARSLTKGFPWLKDEAYSAGLVGLAREIKDYDPAICDNFGAFASMRVRTAILNFLRINRNQKRDQASLESMPDEIDEIDDSRVGRLPVGWEIEYEDFVRGLGSILESPMRDAFELTYLHCNGSDRRSAAKILGIKPNSVASSHSRAIRKIRSQLGTGEVA